MAGKRPLIAGKRTSSTKPTEALQPEPPSQNDNGMSSAADICHALRFSTIWSRIGVVPGLEITWLHYNPVPMIPPSAVRDERIRRQIG